MGPQLAQQVIDPAHALMVRETYPAWYICLHGAVGVDIKAARTCDPPAVLQQDSSGFARQDSGVPGNDP